jgi:hypothetical protein
VYITSFYNIMLLTPVGRNSQITVLWLVLLALAWSRVNAQSTQIVVTVDLGAGLIYFLVIFFFALNFGTPIVRWLYLNYFRQLVEKASKEVSKMSKRFSERLSDAGRKVSQSIRAEK